MQNAMMETQPTFDAARAFGGVDRLYGAGTRERFARAQVCVVGVGGVGSWAVEALVRSGIGALTLIDPDHLAESNLNRQLPALVPTLGAAKVSALAERIAQINPHCMVTTHDQALSEDNLAALMSRPFDGVIDAIDAPRVKAALAAHARAAGCAFVMCGAAGGKVDATQLRTQDIANCTHDPLLASVRTTLRKHYQFPKTGKMRVACISSAQPRAGVLASAQAGAALACAGYGSSVVLTASMGFMAAGVLLDALRTRGK